MSLKALLRFGKELFKAKKPSATPATGQQQKQITYTPKPSQAQGQDLAVQEIRNPPVVLKKTKPLQMGDDTAPAFGSSTYDWAMRKGRGKYSADEWLDHLTSTRKVNFRVFGQPSSRIERAEKRFKYDSGPFAGKEVNVSKEELFDTNLAAFNEAGDLTGGLLFAAKKFGIKLDANEIGAMIKLNPLNRLKPIEFGVPKGAQEAYDVAAKNAKNTIRDLQVKYKDNAAVKAELDQLQYTLKVDGIPSRGALREMSDSLKNLTNSGMVAIDEKKALNKVIGDINNKMGPLQTTKTKYGGETNYTLQGGKDYREAVFTLDEAIPTNSRPFNKGGHFTESLPENTNNIYHIRYDTRFTPEGKKVFMINEIQSDVNQSIAKSLSKSQQLNPEFRVNPFQKDIEISFMLNQRGKLANELSEAMAKGDQGLVNQISNDLARTSQILNSLGRRAGNQKDYFPMVEADQYGDHALKYLMNKAARENVDYVAVAPFDKLSFRQGYKAGNERFYGYANGKGINKSGTAVMPNNMKRAARFYGSKAGPIKISLSDPSKPYKSISQDTFKYPKDHKLSGKTVKSNYHDESRKDPFSGSKQITAMNPNLYFDGFAIKVNSLMRGTQKTYKATGGLVVDIFKPIRYNQPWQ